MFTSSYLRTGVCKYVIILIFLSFICVCIRFPNVGVTQIQMRTQGEKHSFHRFHATTEQFNQDEVDVFRHCGNFLCFSTEFFFSCASKHVKTTNILVPYRGILKERKLCELEQHFKPFTFLRVVLQILYCALSGSW